MQRTAFGDMACSIARTLDAAGEPWSPLIVRDVFIGITRFDELQRDLGISRKVLAERLERLIDEGILERRAYSERPPRHDYVLTKKGEELCEVIFAIVAWGDRWKAGESGPPALLRHQSCGKLTRAEVRCAECGEPLHASDVQAEVGPGGLGARGTVVMAERLASVSKL